MTSALLVDLSERYGGADVRVEQLARCLPDHGIRVATAVLVDGGVVGPLQASGATVHEVGRRKWDPRIAFRLRRLIRKEGFTVVDSHNPQSQFWAWLALIGIGGVTQVATVHSVYRDEHSGRRRGRLYESLLRLERLRGGRLIAVSDSVGQHLSNTLGFGSRVTVIANAITATPTSVPGNDAADLLTELSWVDVDLVVCLGRLAPAKGQEYLLRAVAELVAGWPQLRCLVIGAGPEEGRLRTPSAELDLDDVVHFAGFRHDGKELMGRALMLVQPSLTEGMPYAVLEAMAAGVPVVASAVGGLRELNDGIEARLVPPAAPSALAAAMTELRSDPTLGDALAAGGLEVVRRDHDLESMVTHTMNLYASDT